MEIRVKKQLLSNIHKLPVSFHEQIFEKILRYNMDTKYNSNSTTTFIDLNDLDDKLIDILIAFVELCHDSIEYNNQRDLLYKKAKENINDLYSSDYCLDNLIDRTSSNKSA